MYLKTTTIKGVTRLYFYESYSNNGKTSSRCVESLGRLDELKKLFPDPIAHFKMVAIDRTQQEKNNKNIFVPIDLNEKLTTEHNSLKNLGYGIFKQLYKELELDKFWNWKSHGRSFQFSADQIFRLLTFARIIDPASKKATFENRHQFFEQFDGFSIDDVYAALDIIADNQNDLQKWIFDHSSSICNRDTSIAYFDCTNYYFDIASPDIDFTDDDGNIVDYNGNPANPKYRKRGPEKNHRPDPIVQLGLLMDRNGIPLAFDLFPGNESEKVHFRPVVKRFKKDFADSRIIFVADRGINTSDNIYYLNGDNRNETNTKDGYVYGQSVRSASDEFKEWVLKKDEYTDEKILDDDGNEIIFRHKSRIYPKKIEVNTTIPEKSKKKKNSVIIDQKQMVYYSAKYAKKQKLQREIMISRAKDLINNPKKYDRISAKGSTGYVVNLAFDKTTGEIINSRKLYLDEEKIKEEEKYDGYYSIVTSELNLKDAEIRNIYKGLSRIEDSFKISKSDFSARPVFVRTNKHLDAHFTTCFTALVLIRLLENKLKLKFPASRIINSMRKYNCVQIDVNTFQIVYFDEILKACEDAFQIELNNKYRTRQQLRRQLRY